MNIQDRFFHAMPIRVKRTTDWSLPLIAGFGVGVTVGVCIGLLTAPSTGETARLRLREGASRMRDKASQLASKAKGQLATSAERVESRIAS
jgi:gas vesicle protein